MFGKSVLSLFCLCFVFLASPTIAEKANSSQQQGWINLFDGRSFAGWKASEHEDTFSVTDGMIVVKGKRSHLFYVGEVEKADFKDFEFKADVMTMPGANSGIYFHTEYQQTGWPAKGYESQVNNTHSDTQKTGGLYAAVRLNSSPAQDKQWFTQHIIVRGKHVIVKIDGNTVVDYVEPDDVSFPDRPGRKLSSGTFALQGHDPGSIVYYKNIMVKPLPSGPQWIELFNGKDLAGWKQLNGTAKYEVRDGVIFGTTVRGSPNSFLCTDKNYSDFILELEFKVDPALNSGVQIRSNSFKEFKNGRVHGYQVEIDPSERAWTAGVYDEARRGWLNDLKDNEPARKAFKQNQWNHIRVEAVGNSIKTWLNGISAADLKDSMTASGFIGLQVHSSNSEKPLQVCWRNIRIKDLTAGAERIKVAVVTGGHDFEQKPFLEMFNSFEGMEYMHVALKDDSEIFEDISSLPYDVIVLYNMTQKISTKRQKNFVNLLNKGVGLVALHHSIAAFPGWPEYRKIIGARFLLSDVVENGISYKMSTYKHDVDIPISIENKHHPITKDMKGFTIHDETYQNCLIEPDNNILLVTDEPSNDKGICWTRKYGNSKVCYIQLGHGFQAYNNENYRTLVANAIKWSADRLD